MTDKFNVSKKKKHTQPHDANVVEKCEKCSNDIVYRKKSYFNKTTYYKICNSCGWYKIVDGETWRNIIKKTDASESKK